MKVLSTVASVIAIGTSAVDGLQMNVGGSKPDGTKKVSPKGRRRGGASAPTARTTRIALAAIPEIPIGSDEQAGDVQGANMGNMEKSKNTADWKILKPIVGRVKCSWPSADAQTPPNAADPIELTKKEWREGYLLGVELDGNAAVLFDDTKEAGKIPVNRCFQSTGTGKEPKKTFTRSRKVQAVPAYHTKNMSIDSEFSLYGDGR